MAIGQVVSGINTKTPSNQIANEVEKKRDKGGGLLKKSPPEALAYLKLIYLPYARVDFQYLHTKFLGKKEIRKSSTAIRLFAVDTSRNLASHFEAKLIESLSKEKLSAISEGYFLPEKGEGIAELFNDTIIGGVRSECDKERFNKHDTDDFGHTMYDTRGYERTKEQWSSALNVGSDDLMEIQTATKTELFYMPYWIAKLENDKRTRFFVFDWQGKTDSKISDIMNTNYDFVGELENSIQEIHVGGSSQPTDAEIHTGESSVPADYFRANVASWLEAVNTDFLPRTNYTRWHGAEILLSIAAFEMLRHFSQYDSLLKELWDKRQGDYDAILNELPPKRYISGYTGTVVQEPRSYHEKVMRLVNLIGYTVLARKFDGINTGLDMQKSIEELNKLVGYKRKLITWLAYDEAGKGVSQEGIDLMNAAVKFFHENYLKEWREEKIREKLYDDSKMVEPKVEQKDSG